MILRSIFILIYSSFLCRAFIFVLFKDIKIFLKYRENTYIAFAAPQVCCLYSKFGVRWFCLNFGFGKSVPGLLLMLLFKFQFLGDFLNIDIFVHTSVFSDFVRTPMFNEKDGSLNKNRCLIEIRTRFWSNIWNRLQFILTPIIVLFISSWEQYRVIPRICHTQL